MQVKTIYTISVIILLINGIFGCIGGISLILDPTGGILGMSLHQLLFLPFKDYLVPGILLLIINGISSLLVAFLALKKTRNVSVFIFTQGIVSTAWIIFEATTNPHSFLQLIFGTIGIILIFLGVILSKRKFIALP